MSHPGPPTVECISTDDHVSTVRVHFTLPADVISAAGLDLRIEPAAETSGGGYDLVLRGVPRCAAQRVPIPFEVDEDSVRAKFKVCLWVRVCLFHPFRLPACAVLQIWRAQTLASVLACDGWPAACRGSRALSPPRSP